MAIVILGSSECSICKRVLDDSEPIVLFPHFIEDDTHPLWRHSDSGVHKACFLTWEHADEFRRIFNETWNRLVPDHPRRMLEDGEIIDIS